MIAPLVHGARCAVRAVLRERLFSVAIVLVLALGPFTLAAAPAILVSVALLGCLLPMRRAPCEPSDRVAARLRASRGRPSTQERRRPGVIGSIMRILLTKISDQRHSLEIVRADGSREKIELVTREFLFHDLLHYAVESSMRTQGGVWGSLASGKTLADLNDRSGASMKEYAGTLALVEGTVGMMSGVIKSGVPAANAVAAHRRYREQLGQAPEPWFTESFAVDVSERMRRLQRHWKATPYGGCMEILWDEAATRE